jgi:hypothetical protein
MFETLTNNWWQILVASFAYFALGGFWYSPAFLGKTWAKGHGVKMDPELRKQTNMAKLFAMSLLCTLALSLLVAHLCINANAAVYSDYLQSGLIIGMAGFAAMSMGFIYLQKPMSIFLIDGLYHLIGCQIAASIYYFLQI